MSGIPAIGPNFRSKISFKAEENKPKTEEQQPTEEEGMSKNTKIGVAVGAAVALAALGYAGYKGHLGKGLQKMLGGAEKAADDLKVKTEVPDAKPNGADAAPKGNESPAANAGKGSESDVSTEKVINAKEIKKNPDNIYNLDDETFGEVQKLAETNIAECEKDSANAYKNLMSYMIKLNAEVFGASKEAFPKKEAELDILRKKIVNEYSEQAEKDDYLDILKTQIKNSEEMRNGKPASEIAAEHAAGAGAKANELDNTPLVKSLTIEQRRGVLKDILPDAPVLVSIVERSGLLEKIDEIPNKHNFTIKKLNNFVSEMFSEIKKTPGDELIFNELVGKNSLLFKKINEITIGDLNGLPEKISKSEYLAEKLKSGDKTFDLASDFSELAKKLDSNTTLDKLIKMLYKDVEFEPEKTGVEYIADYIQAQLKGLS